MSKQLIPNSLHKLYGLRLNTQWIDVYLYDSGRMVNCKIRGELKVKGNMIYLWVQHIDKGFYGPNFKAYWNTKTKRFENENKTNIPNITASGSFHIGGDSGKK